MATGLGGMQLAEGVAEQNADKNAANDMAADIETMHCDYGNGKQVKIGPDEIELPGANNAELIKIRAEYIALAESLKERKLALGMPPGIESEEIMDRATSGLYDDENIGITAGSEVSLYRAQVLENEKDQSDLEKQEKEAKNRMVIGGVAAGAGVIGGIAGNAIINKDSPKEQSGKINQEYDKKLSEISSEQDDIIKQLNQATKENAKEVEKYNEQVKQHRTMVERVNESVPGCRNLFDDYITIVSSMNVVENETDAVPRTEFPNIAEKKDLLNQCTQCDYKGAVFDADKKECKCSEEKPIEKDGKCVEKTEEGVPETDEITEEVSEQDSAQNEEGVPETDETTEEVSEQDNAQNEEEAPETDEAEETNKYQYCPATGNGLKSINDKTIVGDFCSSTNIRAGEVVWKEKTNNCTCVASACNSGYYFNRGACFTEGKPVNNLCPRSVHQENKDNNTTQKCVTFCGQIAEKSGCKYSSVIMQHSTKQCICNPEEKEMNAVHESMKRAESCPTAYYQETEKNNTNSKCYNFCQEKAKTNNCKHVAAIIQHSNNQCVCNPGQVEYRKSDLYKKVCGQDKGKTGKDEYCIKDFFVRTQTHISNAVAFAQDYARLKQGKTIVCSNKERQSGTDYYIACATKGGTAYYEFKFDDVRESIDGTRRLSERVTLCNLIGGKPGDTYTCQNIDSDKCKSLSALAKKYGHTVAWNRNRCVFESQNTMTSKDFEKSLAKIDGLDNRAFFKLNIVTARGNFDLEEEIARYVKNKKPNVKKVVCDPGHDTIKAADGWFERIVGDHDDIKRCYVDNKPIDFVFDDLSESTKNARDAGEQGAKCISNNGKFDGHYCRGLTKKECTELENKLRSELKAKGWAGDGDLVDWDESAGACELNAAQFANNVNKVGKYTAIAGLTIGGTITGGTSTSVAIGLMATELAGMAGEIYVERKKELLPQQWANEFLVDSRKCQKTACAETTLRSNFGKISKVGDMLNRDVLQQVDSELARLGELLPDDRLINIMNDPKAPNCWETWECQERIFVIMQMASLGAAVGKALVRFTKVIAKKAGTAATKKTTALARTSSNADNVTSVTKGGTKPGPTGGGAGDAAKGADKTSDGAKAISATDDSARTGSQTKNAEHNTDSGVHKSGTNKGSSNGGQNANDGSRTSGTADNAGRAADNTADMTRGANKADDVSDASKSTSDAGKVDELIKNGKYQSEKYMGHNFAVSKERYYGSAANRQVKELQEKGYYAARVPTKGVSGEEEYVIVAIKKENVSGLEWDGDDLVKQLNNSTFLRNIDLYKNQEITKIGKTPVFIEDFGSISGRGVVTVRVGEKQIPFYVSTGTAGKTEVPTGKWEVFWGFDGNWFAKGSKEQILTHYNSPELKQIADVLDSKLGDPRNVELVLQTVGRNSVGGKGIVGKAEGIGNITREGVNNAINFNLYIEDGWPFLMHDTKQYLSGLLQ